MCAEAEKLDVTRATPMGGCGPLGLPAPTRSLRLRAPEISGPARFGDAGPEGGGGIDLALTCCRSEQTGSRRSMRPRSGGHECSAMSEVPSTLVWSGIQSLMVPAWGRGDEEEGDGGRERWREVEVEIEKEGA